MSGFTADLLVRGILLVVVLLIKFALVMEELLRRCELR